MTKATDSHTTPGNGKCSMSQAMTPQEAEDISARIARAWGLAGALKLLARTEMAELSDLERSSFMDSLEEMAGAIRDSLSPAMDAADKLNVFAYGAAA